MARHIFAIILIIYIALGHDSINLFVSSEVHSYNPQQDQQHQPKHHIRHNNHHNGLNHNHHHHPQHQQHQQQQHQQLQQQQQQQHHHNQQQNQNHLPNHLMTHQNHKLTPNLWTILDKGSKLHRGSMNSDKTSDLFNINNSKEFIYNSDLLINDDNTNMDSDNSDGGDRIYDDELRSSSSNNNNNNNNNNNDRIKCPKCTGSTNNVRVSEEELTELRIEFVKNQILQKLRLKERPKVSNSELPRPIYEGATMHHDDKALSKDLDDYYARTSQKFIFMEQERKECYRFSQSPSICFSFKIDGDVDSYDVNTAELWVYKKQSRKDLLKQTLVVSEMEKDVSTKYLPKIKPIAIQSTGVEEGWIKFDIAWPIKKWFGNHDLSHLIQISCQSCEIDENESLLSTDKDYRPFIVIDTQSRRQRRRQKRSVNCTAGATECCREKLYIDFAEIGWNDWIISPPGYNAYFCRGSCSSAASITLSNTHHSSFLRKVFYQRETDGRKPLELIPCCTAKKYSSLQLFYRDSNNTATLKTLPNMVVEACGCM